MGTNDGHPFRDRSVQGPWLALGLLLAGGLLAGVLPSPASAQDTVDLTLEASEDCPDTTFCFEVTEGDLDDLEAGNTVSLTLVNPEDNVLDHNVHLTNRSEADVGGQTPEDAAFAHTEDASPGEEVTTQVEVPEDVDAIYLWCSVNNHEEQGMYEEVEMGGLGDGGTNESPGPGMLVAMLLASLLAGRERG